MRAVLLIAALLLGGCNQILGIGGDVQLRDGGPDPQMPPDAREPLPQHEVVSGAAHVKGAKYSADVQVGHVVPQAPVEGAAYTAEGNAAVKP